MRIPQRSPRGRVRKLREQKGLTQFTLAYKSGLSLQTISLVERGGICTERTVAAIAAALGVLPAEIATLGREGSSLEPPEASDPGSPASSASASTRARTARGR